MTLPLSEGPAWRHQCLDITEPFITQNRNFRGCCIVEGFVFAITDKALFALDQDSGFAIDALPFNDSPPLNIFQNYTYGIVTTESGQIIWVWMDGQKIKHYLCKREYTVEMMSHQSDSIAYTIDGGLLLVEYPMDTDERSGGKREAKKFNIGINRRDWYRLAWVAEKTGRMFFITCSGVRDNGRVYILHSVNINTGRDVEEHFKYKDYGQIIKVYGATETSFYMIMGSSGEEQYGYRICTDTNSVTEMGQTPPVWRLVVNNGRYVLGFSNFYERSQRREQFWMYDYYKSAHTYKECQFSEKITLEWPRKNSFLYAGGVGWDKERKKVYAVLDNGTISSVIMKKASLDLYTGILGSSRYPNDTATLYSDRLLWFKSPETREATNINILHEAHEYDSIKLYISGFEFVSEDTRRWDRWIGCLRSALEDKRPSIELYVVEKVRAMENYDNMQTFFISKRMRPFGAPDSRGNVVSREIVNLIGLYALDFSQFYSDN